MNYPVSLKCTRKAKEVCDSVSPKKNTVFHSPAGCGSLEDKEALLLFSSEISSCFQGVSVSVLNSHLVKCLGSKSRKSRRTYWCMYDTVFWIHMLFCIKNKLLQDYEYIYPTYLSIFVSCYTINFCVHIYHDIYLLLLFKPLHSWSVTWEGKKTNLVILSHWTERAIRHLPHIFPLSP